MSTQTHLPPKFSISSDFGHFTLKMLENVKFKCVKKKVTQISLYLGDVHVPHLGDVHVPPLSALMLQFPPSAPVAAHPKGRPV